MWRFYGWDLSYPVMYFVLLRYMERTYIGAMHRRFLFQRIFEKWWFGDLSYIVMFWALLVCRKTLWEKTWKKKNVHAIKKKNPLWERRSFHGFRWSSNLISYVFQFSNVVDVAEINLCIWWTYKALKLNNFVVA